MRCSAEVHDPTIMWWGLHGVERGDEVGGVLGCPVDRGGRGGGGKHSVRLRRGRCWPRSEDAGATVRLAQHGKPEAQTIGREPKGVIQTQGPLPRVGLAKERPLVKPR